MAHMNRLRTGLVLAAFVGVAACAEPRQAAAPAGPPEGCILDAPADVIGGPISMIRHDGAPVTQADFAGRPALLYFGFAFCPDVCPLALQSAKAALGEAGPVAAEVQPILVSLDPERDPPEVLSRYIASDAFPAGLVALTGTTEQSAAAAQSFRVAWRRNEDPGSAAGYLIDHSSFFYLMDRNWRLTAMYPSTLAPKDQAACLRLALASEN